ncbi:sensor domain-containing diguanylate cyclase [Vibrio sp. B1FLJ16]|uniref:sensor domain-containing diguanylate cyclase n=4 Tax=Vibrio sp. B1FLJ16 TaxID=2751178 RepID=UPI001BA753C7|nr:sensor domain-containing diguanylate cyclase [Vibrio sp. B1FLJ16]
MNDQIEKQRIYAELINISGKQRMLSQKLALMTARVDNTNEQGLIEYRNNLIHNMESDHDFIISNLPSEHIEEIYFSSPYDLNEHVVNYLNLLKKSSVDDDTYIQSVFYSASKLLLKLDFAVNAFQEESEYVTNKLQKRGQFVLIGSLLTLSIEYFLIFLPIFKRNKRNEQQLSELNDELQFLIKNNPDGMIMLSMDGGIKMFSQMANEMLGYAEEELSQLTLFDLDCHLSKEQIKTNISSLSMDEVSIFETKLTCKDGSVFDALISARIITLNGEEFIYSSTRNVTELNKIKHERDIDTLKLKIAAQSANMGFWQWNPYTREASCDEQMHEIFEVDHSDSSNNSFFWVNKISDKHRENVINDVRNIVESKTAFQSNFILSAPNGEQKIIQYSATPLFNENGEIETIVGTNLDITERQNHLSKINELNKQLEQVQEIIELGYWKLNHQSQEMFWSEKIYSFFEVDKDEYTPSYLGSLDFIHPDDREMVKNAQNYSDEPQNKLNSITFRLVMPDGRIKYIHEMAQTFYDTNTSALQTIGALQDITARRVSEIENERYLELIDQNILSTTMSIDGTITNVSQAFSQLCGYSKNELIGHKRNTILHQNLSTSERQSFWQILNTKDVWQGESKNMTKAKQAFWLTSVLSPIYDDFNRIVGYSEISQDITGRKLAEELSITDQLTGINNRLHLEKVLETKIKGMHNEQSKHSLLIIDLDHFKSINDTYGHLVGDEVLKHFTHVLTKNTRKTDCVGRWGGEEFLVICPNTDLNSAMILAEKLRSQVEKSQFPTVEQVTCCIGVAEYKSRDKNKEQALARADKALYVAKEQGRNKAVSYGSWLKTVEA